MNILRVSSAVLLGLVAGCVGDSAIKVKGHVVDANGLPVEDCQLERWEDQTLAESQRVDSSFLTTFTLPPGRSRFSLRLNCERSGQVRKLGVFEVGGGERYANPLDLGAIKPAK